MPKSLSPPDGHEEQNYSYRRKAITDNEMEKNLKRTGPFSRIVDTARSNAEGFPRKGTV